MIEMASVQTLRRRFESVNREMQALRARDAEFIQRANADGHPHWTPALRAERAPLQQQMNELLYQLNYRRELLECRTIEARVRWERIEFGNEESYDEQKLVVTKVRADASTDLAQMDAAIDSYLFEHGFVETQQVPPTQALEMFRHGELGRLDLYLLARYETDDE